MEKIIHLICIEDNKLFAKKRKRIENLHTVSENILSAYRDGTWRRKMLHGNNEKRETTHEGRNVTTKLRKNRTHGDKETYKYLRILEADTIKQLEMKEKV